MSITEYAEKAGSLCRGEAIRAALRVKFFLASILSGRQ